ncbi:MAG: hypothetical protein QOD39_1866 [Mycobacterium sp.]|nr:hypothetical protein [Mycobacterium sp.]
MRTALLVIFASFAMLIAGCGSTLLPDKTAQSVTDFVKKNTGFTPKDVKCPDGVDAKVGTEFDCHFTGPDANYTAHVKVTKVDGDNVEFYIETKPTG